MFNDVWFSADGTSWTLATGEARCLDRVGHAAATFRNRLWVLGGYSWGTRDYFDDVWYSPDCSTWLDATEHVAWAPRAGHAACVYCGRLWITGGAVSGRETFHDVWYSVDAMSWVLATDNTPWLGRSGHGCVAFDDSLWVIGGCYYQGDSLAYYLGDVWRTSDGANWTEMAHSGPWHGRTSHGTAVFGNKMWILGGYYYEGSGPDERLVLLNDVWYSPDGATWTELPDTPWSPRENFAIAVLAGRLWLFGGTADLADDGYETMNDIWYLQPPHSADTDGDWAISVREIGRVVGLYNAGAYRCDSTTQDGYAPFPGPHQCEPHDSDYDPEDWTISLSELSRLVTFYNAGGYTADPDTPDGFAPGTAGKP